MSSANKFEAPMKHNNLETRVALVEQSIGHISETLIRIERKMDNGFERIEDKFIKFERKMDDGFKKIDEKFDRLEIELKKDIKSFDSRLWTNFYWTLGTMFTLATLMCGILAKGFKWFG
jgi:hypothetical protein